MIELSPEQKKELLEEFASGTTLSDTASTLSAAYTLTECYDATCEVLREVVREHLKQRRGKAKQ